MAPAKLLVTYLILAATLAPAAWAQTPLRPNEILIEAFACGEELKGQPDLWVMDVIFRPIRMVEVEVTDPKTGQTVRERIHYMTYRAANRELNRKVDPNDPQNPLDPLSLPQTFIPRFTLVAIDDPEPNKETTELEDNVCAASPARVWQGRSDSQQVALQDVIVLEAQNAINKREKMGNYKNGVEIQQPIPTAKKPGAADDQFIEGVAMWRGVPVTSDRFSLFMTGFSNGVRRTRGVEGAKDVIREKTIVQLFVRQGDEFKLEEREIRIFGTPQWMYR